MLITFKSKAAAEFVMYKEHAKTALDLLGKDIERGVLTPDELPHAIAVLEAAVAASKVPSPEAGRDDEPAQDEDDDENEGEPAAPVSFATRMFPLLEMLHAARRTHNHVMWGV